VPRITVRFGIDASGMLSVYAADETTGQSEITVTIDRGRRATALDVS